MTEERGRSIPLGEAVSPGGEKDWKPYEEKPPEKYS